MVYAEVQQCKQSKYALLILKVVIASRVAESEDYGPTPRISKLPTPTLTLTTTPNPDSDFDSRLRLRLPTPTSTLTPDSDSDFDSDSRLRLPTTGKIFFLN